MIRHIIYIPFKDVGIGDSFRDEDWLKDRIQIFKNYTLKSLQNQTDKVFLLWLSFTKEDQHNQQVLELKKYMQSSGFEVVFTYNGLMYWDDKFGGSLLDRIKNFLRILRRCWRNDTLDKFWYYYRSWRANEEKNNSLLFRLNLALSEIPQDPLCTWVYLTRLDSDDMLMNYFSSVVKLADPDEGRKSVITCGSGFVYNKNTGQLAEWNPLTNPPFHTILFPSDTFYDASKHLDFYGDFKSHEDIPKIFKPVMQLHGAYCVLIHSGQNQISTIWDHPFRGKLIDNQEEKQEILREFGIRQ